MAKHRAKDDSNPKQPTKGNGKHGAAGSDLPPRGQGIRYDNTKPPAKDNK